METTYQKIIRQTGAKPTSCKCQLCRSQCTHTPCIGTPEDMAKIISAGYADRVAPTDWCVGMINGLTDKPVEMVAPLYDNQKKACTFYTNGLCELHDKGLKPTEGKLSSHTVKHVTPKKLLAWAIAKEWMKMWREADQYQQTLNQLKSIDL